MTHIIRIVRAVLLKGNGAAEIVGDLWPILAFTLAITIVAIWSYRETLD
jgi:ABC-2 type transport system permease protein